MQINSIKICLGDVLSEIKTVREQLTHNIRQLCSTHVQYMNKKP